MLLSLFTQEIMRVLESLWYQGMRPNMHFLQYHSITDNIYEQIIVCFFSSTLFKKSLSSFQKSNTKKNHWKYYFQKNEDGTSQVSRPHVVLCLVAQSCLTLCDPMDCSPPGSSVHGILQARTLGWIAMPSSWGSSQPREWTQVSCIAGRFITIWVTREAHNCWNWRESVSSNSCLGMLSLFNCIQLSVTLWTTDPRVLCPWNSPGKNTGEGSHSLLQGNLPHPGTEPISWVSCMAGKFLTHWASWEAPWSTEIKSVCVI